MISTFIAFAMAFQSFLASDVMAFVMAGASNDFRTITICTGYGYKQITLDAENNPVTPPPTTEPESCPTCVLASGIAPTLPANPGGLYDAKIGEAVPFYQHRLPADRRQSPTRHSRAPPLFAHT